MPPHQIVRMALRQPVAQHLEARAAVAGAGDGQLGIDRDAALVLDGRNEPRGLRIVRVRRDGKAEFRRADRGQLVPAGAAILRADISDGSLTSPRNKRGLP